LASFLYEQQRYDEAIPLLRELLAGEVLKDYERRLPKIREMLATAEAKHQATSRPATQGSWRS